MTVSLDATQSPRPVAGQSPARNVSWTAACIVTMSLAILTAVTFPGRVSFINDEPRQLAKAFYANENGTLAADGLKGNFQITYGPTAAQIYQLILLFTHDPVALAMVRAGLSAGITALGLLWLARSLRLNPWFAAAVVLAPFLWVFHRIIWDASWAIPIGTLGLAAYAAYMRNKRPLWLAVAVFCTLILPFIHPQDILLAAPIGVHMLWRHWGGLLRHWPAVLVPLLTVLVLNWQYIQQVRKEVRQMRDGNTGVAQMAYPDGVVAADKNGLPPRLKSALAPLLSGRILSGHKYVDDGFQTKTLGDRIIRAGKAGSYLIYPLIWLGTAVGVWRIWRRYLHRRDGHKPDTDRPLVSASTALDAITAIAVGSAILQALLFAAKKIPIEPQYFFGTFVAHVMLAWLAVDWLKRFRLGLASIAVYGLSVGVITIGSIWLDSGRPLTGSPRAPRPEILPLGMQVEAAEALNAYADTTVFTDVNFYHRFPQALRSLRLLMQPDGKPNRTSSGGLLLTFGDGPDGPETRLVVIEVKGPAQLPPDAQPMIVTPLPNGWLPGVEG